MMQQLWTSAKAWGRTQVPGPTTLPDRGHTCSTLRILRVKSALQILHYAIWCYFLHVFAKGQFLGEWPGAETQAPQMSWGAFFGAPSAGHQRKRIRTLSTVAPMELKLGGIRLLHLAGFNAYNALGAQ